MRFKKEKSCGAGGDVNLGNMSDFASECLTLSLLHLDSYAQNVQLDNSFGKISPKIVQCE